ncbi:MAG TPA: hypothetical protein VJS69_10275 [Candidatus Krumholzibacteria bacterium]|nr:hypothetical protein [Candidatus Krumholzibacteria bacterium]
MSKQKLVLALLAIALLFIQVADPRKGNSGIVDTCNSTLTANSGVVLVCPLGDGDPLTAPVGGGSCQITLTVRDNANVGIPGIPATDMWLVGCNDGLLLCGLSSGSAADAVTNASGVTTFSAEPVSGGCDTGLFAVVQGRIIQDTGTCLAKCLNIAARSPDYKSAGAPGPAPCAGDLRCPDSKVTNADFSWFVTHYPTTGNPGATYFACADYAAPLGSPIGLADFSKFTVHFAGAGHKCPI